MRTVSLAAHGTAVGVISDAYPKTFVFSLILQQLRHTIFELYSVNVHYAIVEAHRHRWFRESGRTYCHGSGTS